MNSKISTGSGKPLTGMGPSGRTSYVTFGEPQGLGRSSRIGPGRRQLFHAGREVGGLADRRVVHAQIVADGADDDLAGVEAHADLDLATRASGAMSSA